MFLPETPAGLERAEFARVIFVLEFQDPCDLRLDQLLRLRRELLQAISVLAAVEGSRERFRPLFSPEVSLDVQGRRRHQKPTPPFVILPEAAHACLYEAGDQLRLPVIFWGKGVAAMADFLPALQMLGRQGISRGEGIFEVVALETADAAGHFKKIWREGQPVEPLCPAISSAAWELDRLGGVPQQLTLQLLTPARLLSHGRPLFRPVFSRVFPFVLRRVTSVLFSHCGVELEVDPRELLTQASLVRESDSSLCWEDWRTLEGQDHAVDLGGVTGSTTLAGDALIHVAWVLRLGALMGIGKSASFGQGHYRLLE
ncbi:CRISPR system precrRNA processing endoribonuclease RAMP protein Cas6 [Desulfuromonas sp. AOP6]|uniref:CRISPR system precrRNA processing endoribonuclease RAMP protein Cas6 n=1 Tax=Desulfuromonas sp. AOP6 TaxID=1566351 RepID=UPI0012878959|nr:CRISPR system precrRNA processing endoribonuclease RAMP protein Cas6 [Desulfuromonas sp. AOP6]BCA80140.1 hypothetical protein AOP6_1927 [Desulfuromonas sp. AOP6]